MNKSSGMWNLAKVTICITGLLLGICAGANASTVNTVDNPAPGWTKRTTRVSGLSGIGLLALLAGCVLFGVVKPSSKKSEKAGKTEKNPDRENKAASSKMGAAESAPAGYEPDILLHTLLENSPDQIYFKDCQSRFVAFSHSFRKLFKIDDENDLKGKTDFDFFAKEHAQQAYDDEQQIIRTGQPILGKLEKETHPDGRVTWALTTKLPWRDDHGNVIGTFGISKDVTSIKETEHKLAYEQQLFQSLLSNVPDAIYFKDRESRFMRVSRSMAAKALKHDAKCRDQLKEVLQATAPGSEAMVGDNPMAGLTDFDLYGGEHAREALKDEQRIIATGVGLVDKVEQEVYPDGTNGWCLTTKLPWKDTEGNIIGTFGISKDITALREAEKKLAYERELFRTLVETIPDAIYFKDRESRFVKLSRSKIERARQSLLRRHRKSHPEGETERLAAHLASTERCAEYLIGKTDFDVADPEHAKVAFEQEQEVIRTGKPIIDQIERFMDDEGKPFWSLTTKMPWRDKDGNIIGTFGISRDITAVKMAEARLEETTKRLAHTSRMAGMAEVATDVLHNVGNVLNSVNVSCSLVIDRVQESSMENLALIPKLLKDNAGRLDEFLTKDPRGSQIAAYLGTVAADFAEQRNFLLAELSQLRNHIDHIKQVVAMQQSYAKVSGVSEIVTAEKLIEDALQINSSALDRHCVRLQKDFDPVPQLQVDKHRVLQIIVNLISNAKYAVSHGPNKDKVITVSVKPDGSDHIIIRVKDNGIGISKDNLTRIFSHGFTTRQDGHGFGLHSGANAVKELGGSLVVESEGEGKGASFTIRLPLKPPTQNKS